jgi:hypothetical protein
MRIDRKPAVGAGFGNRPARGPGSQTGRPGKEGTEDEFEFEFEFDWGNGARWGEAPPEPGADVDRTNRVIQKKITG